MSDWQCDCQCRNEADHVSFTAYRELCKTSKWGVVVTDLSTNTVIRRVDGLFSAEAWEYFDMWRSTYAGCKPTCVDTTPDNPGHHDCVEVDLQLDGCGEKSSIWS